MLSPTLTKFKEEGKFLVVALFAFVLGKLCGMEVDFTMDFEVADLTDFEGKVLLDLITGIFVDLARLDFVVLLATEDLS